MGFLNVFQREITRFLEHPVAWLVAVIIPLFCCVLFCILFSEATPKDLPIAVLNEDNSSISRMFVRNINTLASCKVKYQIANMEEGRELLIEGKAYGIFVIPKDFQKDIYKQKQPQLVFYYNNHRILIGGIVSKDINMMVQNMLVGMDAKIKVKKGLPYKEAIKQSNVINVVDHVRSNPYFNYQYLLCLAAFGHFLQICALFASLWAIGTEFKYGTAKEWLDSANNSILVALAGKLSLYFIIFCIVSAIIAVVYYGFCGVPYFGNVLLGIIATAVYIITCLMLGVIFISVNGNFRFCISGATFYSAIGFALAGVTFPVMAMPLFIKIYAATMPLSYWVRIMVDQTLRDIPVIYDIKFLISLFVIILVTFGFTYRLKVLALDENRWYRL